MSRMFDQWKALQREINVAPPVDAEDACALRVNRTLSSLSDKDRDEAEKFLDELNCIRDPRKLDAWERLFIRDRETRNLESLTDDSTPMTLQRAKAMIFVAHRDQLKSLLSQN